MSSLGWKARFFTIWTGQAFSLVGSALVQFALIWWLTETTGSAQTLATAATVGYLPTIFLGPFAGTLVDRWPRKWVLIVSDGLIALTTALLALLFWLDVAQPWHVFVILFVRSLGDCFQNPAMRATTPLMVPGDQLTRVAGMNSTLQGVMRFAAPPLSALLLTLVGVQGILPLDVVTAIVAIVPLFLVPIPQSATKAVTGTGLRSVLKGFGEGLRYMWNRPGLRLLVATSGLLSLGAALWRTHKSAMAVAWASGLVGIAVYLSTNQAFAMLTLSRQYAAATSETRRSALEAAGEALLAIHNPGVPFQGLGFYASLLLVTVSGLILSLVMLRSGVFGRVTAWSGILANAFMLGLLVMLAVPAPVAPALYAIPPSVSAIFRMLWYVMSAITLWRLGK